MQSCAELEEYLKQDYVGSVESDKAVSGGDNIELTPLEEMIKLRNNYFFKNGSYDYVIYEYTHDGKTDYLKIRLITKSNLKDEIKKQLRGGDAEGNKKEAYMNFKDVYGVTDDLEVFYCSDGLLSAIGASYLNSSLFDNTKVLYESTSPASKALAESMGMSESRDLTISDLRSTTTLTVSDQSGAKDLKFLVDMPKIDALTIKGYTGSLSGIENLMNLKKLYLDNTGGNTNINYEGFSGATSIEELMFFMPTDNEVEKMCTEMSKADYERLSKISLTGLTAVQYQIDSISSSSIAVNDRSKLTNINPLSKLSSLTKQAISTLYINNNQLENLDGIQDFTKLINLYANNNRVLRDGIEDVKSSLSIGKNLTKMESLINLFIGYSNITNEDFGEIKVNTNIENLSIPRKYINNRFKCINKFN